MADLLSNISTLQSSLARRRENARLTQGLAKAEKETTTGLRADLFRDLGQRAAESVRLRNIVSRNEGFIASNKLLAGRMEVTSMAMSDIRKVAEDFLALAVSGSNPGSAISSELQANARIAIDQIIAQANTVYQGSHVFAGVDQDKTPMQGWERTNPSTGLSPQDVMSAIVASGPSSVADVAAIAAEVQSAFDGTHPNSVFNYEASFFNGTPQSAGQRVEARIGERSDGQGGSGVKQCKGQAGEQSDCGVGQMHVFLDKRHQQAKEISVRSVERIDQREQRDRVGRADGPA